MKLSPLPDMLLVLLTVSTLVIDCAEVVETSGTNVDEKEHVSYYTKHVDEYLIINSTTWLVTFQPEGTTDNIVLIKDGVKQVEDWFDWRLEIQSAGIKIDALEIKDSGTFEFRDQKGDLVLVAHLEMKKKKDDDPPPPVLLIVFISVAFVLFGFATCWFTRNKKCWKKCCRKNKSASRAAAPPVTHHSETQAVVPSYVVVPSSAAQPGNDLQSCTPDPACEI